MFPLIDGETYIFLSPRDLQVRNNLKMRRQREYLYCMVVTYVANSEEYAGQLYLSRQNAAHGAFATF